MIRTFLKTENFFFLIILFALSPLLSLPFILYSASNREKICGAMISVFMGIVAMLWAPTGDLYRHNMDYFYFQQMNWYDFIYYLKYKPDFLIYLLSFVFAKLNINYEFVRFILVFVSFQMSFNVFLDAIRCSEKMSRYHVFVFFVFFFSVPFFWIVLGVRFSTAACLFVYGLYYYLKYAKKEGLIYITISLFIHFSMILPLLVLVMSKIRLKWSNRFLFLVLLMVLIFFRPSFLQYLIDVLFGGNYIHLYLSAYISGYWNGEYLEDHSFKFLLSNILTSISMYPLFIIAMKVVTRQRFDEYVRMLLIMICVCLMVSYTLYFRYALLMVLILVYYLFGWHLCILSKKNIICLFLFSLLSFTSQIYSWRRELTISNEKLLFYPIPVSLSSSYSYEWLLENINYDGQAKNLKY